MQISFNLKKKKKKFLIECYYYCGARESSDIHPPFVLGLRPMPRPIIAYEEDSGDHDNLGNRAEDNSVLD